MKKKGELTKVGEMLSEFPLEPQLAKCLVTSPSLFCANEMASITAMLSVPYCFLRPKENLRDADDCRAKFHY